MRLHICPFPHPEKPIVDIGNIKKATQQENTIKDVSVNQLIEYVSKGHTISPGVLEGGLRAENWVEQTCFMVDIDNNNDSTYILTPKNAIDVSLTKGLNPTFYYHTFNSRGEKPKFRLVYILDQPTTSNSEREIVAQTLVSLFDQSDKACKNADRIFFGTNQEVVVLSEASRITLDEIIAANETREIQQQARKRNQFPSDKLLDDLKQQFDFLGYLKNQNGEVVISNSKYVMFAHCQLCGHHKNLVYYHKTKTFMCFSSIINKGGSIIDYLMIQFGFPLGEAIRYFKETLCGIPNSPVQAPQAAQPPQPPEFSPIIERLITLAPEENYSLDDKGFSKLFADVYEDRLCYNVTAKQFYFYTGTHWTEDTEGMEAARKAKELANALLVYCSTIKNEVKQTSFLDYVRKLGQFRFRKTILEDSRDNFSLSQIDFDTNPHLFNCQNGTLNLHSFGFKLHDPRDYITKISNVVYDPNAKSERFETFISEIMMGEVELIRYIQQIMGYSLSAETDQECMWILFGPTTRNGKSTLVETISYMMGNTDGYAMTIQPQTLAQKENRDSRQANEDIARLHGCRFLLASEPPRNMIIDAALLKTLLGRDSITARSLYEKSFEFKPTFKLFMNTNYLPNVRDASLFSSNRVRVIPFERHFKPEEQNQQLKTSLQRQAEVSGIFNWCLNGLKQFKSTSEAVPESVIRSTNYYRDQSDRIGKFLQECIEPSDTALAANKVYIYYVQWCKSSEIPPESKSAFYDELRIKGILSEKGTVDGVTVRNVLRDSKFSNSASY